MKPQHEKDDDRYEFSESDQSDYEYEEAELQEEDDYEKGDDYLLNPNSLETCKKTDYNNGWKRSQPEFSPPFEYQPPSEPKIQYRNEDDAFSHLISPGIINM